MLIYRYHEAVGEACPAAYLARRLGLGRTTVREHLALLYEKGWLQAPGPPAVPRRPFLTRQ